MADKKISIIVEAIVGGARRNLQGLNKDLRELGGGLDVASKAATAAKVAVAGLAGAFAMAKFAEQAMQIARVAAANVALREGFDKLAERAHIDSRVLLESLKEASRGTISEYDLMRQANKDWYTGVAQNTKQYVELMKIAEVKAKDLGVTTSQYWERLSAALASGYPAALRTLGVVIDNEQAYRDYAATIGVAADELTDQEQIQARVNAVIADGEVALRDWEAAGEDATTTAQQFDAATADLSATFKEKLLPAMVPVIRALTTMPTIFDQLGYIAGATIAGIGGSFAELGRLIEQRDWAAILSGQVEEAGWAAARMYAQQDAVAKGTLHTIGTFVDMLQRKVGAAYASVEGLAAGATRRTEGLADAVDKASDVYDKYVRDVQEANYRFGRSVADASFRAIQAAETAAFRRDEILKNARQKDEDDLRKHTTDIRRQWQDLHDALSDIEWDYQQDRSDLMKGAKWWIRNALQKEFAERKRVAASGDTEALKAYDKALRERIRAIDPVYAEELDELEEQFDRKETVEKREARQARNRTRRDFQEQERITRRELGDQLEAWRFHARQRRENERHAMDNLIADNEHRLQVLYDNANRRLAELDEIWRHYGHAHGTSYITQLQHVLSSYTPMLPTPAGPAPYTPIPPGYEFPEKWVNPFGGGGAVSLAGAGGGGVTIEIGQVVVGAGVGPQQARLAARELAEELGPMIRKQSR